MDASPESAPPQPRPAVSRRNVAILWVVVAAVSALFAFLISSDRISADPFPTIFPLALLVGIPALSYWSGVRIRRQNIPLPPRFTIYRRIVTFDWALVVLAFAVLDTQGLPWEFMGFWWVGLGQFLAWTLAGLAGGFVVRGVVGWLTKRGWLPPEIETVKLVPETRTERIVCLLFLAPTIGFCEEVLYRGYLLLVLPRWLGPYGTTWALGLSAVAFGLAHVSNGRSRVLATTLIGVLQSCPLIYSGTLYPSIVAHAVYDAVVLIWLAPRSNKP